MKKYKEKGSIALVVLVLLSMSAIIGVYLTQSLKLNRQTTLLEAYKVKSDMAVDYGTNIFLKRLANYYRNREEVSTPTGFSEEKFIPDEPNKEIKVGYKYDRQKDTTNVEYIFKNRTATEPYIHRFYELIQSGSNELFVAAQDASSTDIVLPNEVISGQIAITGVSNDSLMQSTYYVVAYDKTNKSLNIYTVNEINNSINLERQIQVSSLYSTKPGSTRESISLNDLVKAQAIYNPIDEGNPSDDTVNLYIAITDRENNQIDLFKMDISTYNYSYINSLTTTYDNIDFTGAYYRDENVDPLLNDKELLYLTTTAGKNINIYECYPREANSIVSTPGTTLDYDFYNMSASAVWNLASGNAPILYISIAQEYEDIADANKVKSKVHLYSSTAELSGEELFKDNSLDGLDVNLDQIKLLAYYDTNVLKVKAYIIGGNPLDKKIYSFYKYLGDKWNRSLIPTSVNEGIGRISGTVVKHNYSGAQEYKILAINPTQIVKHVTITNQPLIPNVNSEAYNPAKFLASKSNVLIKVTLEYLEDEISKARRIEKVNVSEYNRNQ